MSETNGQNTEVLEGQAVEVEQPGQAVAVPAPAPPALAVTPQASPKDLVARLDAIKETQKLAMTEGVDFGAIPGTDKPTLLKPGAEKLAALFQLDVQPSNEKRWEADGHLTVVSRVTIFHAPTGARLGSGEGICSTREKKYAYRNAQRTCPDCGEAAVIKGKKEYGGGWLCFKKKGGCGAKWSDGAEVIEKQETGEIDNPDLPDLWNTVDKMATKRALVAAVLIVTGASAVFTQDVEDMQGEPDEQPPADAPTPEPVARLKPERVERIIGAFGALKLKVRDINLMLGAAGANGLPANTAQAIKAHIASLGEVEADALEAELEKRAAAESQDADAEQPDEGAGDPPAEASQEGGEADVAQP